MPETVARLRYHRASPSKVRQVLRLIVGADANEAREILRFCERGPSEPVMKLLDSAIANAEHNDNVPEDELYVLRAFADEGPTSSAGARGRLARIRKRTSHHDRGGATRTSSSTGAVSARRPTPGSAGQPPAWVAASQRKAEREAAREAEHDHDHDEL
jgi:large subunit ribosomal protein L22